jgi:hypothetical protein
MVEHFAERADWFLPNLIRLLNSPTASLLSAAPILSYDSAQVNDGGEVPSWAPLWAKADAQDDPRVGPSVIPTIAITEQEQRISEALVSDRYAWRGYGAGLRGEDEWPAQRELTLLAWSGYSVVGTMTMGFDDGAGLLADRTYASNLEQIRGEGRHVCEFTRFAVAAGADSRATISGLFDLSYVLGRKMLGVTDVVIEVNPRHVAFYRRAFGFAAVSDVRICERVNAPAVLLRLNVDELDGRMRSSGVRMPGELAANMADRPVAVAAG